MARLGTPMRLVEINEPKSAKELRARQDEARRRIELGAPVAIERFGELDKVESLEMSKCEIESVRRRVKARRLTMTRQIITTVDQELMDVTAPEFDEECVSHHVCDVLQPPRELEAVGGC